MDRERKRRRRRKRGERGTKNTARKREERKRGKREAVEDGIEVKVDIWREERTEETLFYLPDRIPILAIILTDPCIERCRPASSSFLLPSIGSRLPLCLFIKKWPSSRPFHLTLKHTISSRSVPIMKIKIDFVSSETHFTLPFIRRRARSNRKGIDSSEKFSDRDARTGEEEEELAWTLSICDSVTRSSALLILRSASFSFHGGRATLSPSRTTCSSDRFVSSSFRSANDARFVSLELSPERATSEKA